MTTASRHASIPPLFAALGETLEGDIDGSPETLLAYSEDVALRAVRPQVVIYPKTTNDLRRILRQASEYTIPVTLRGKNTSRHGAALGEGIVVDMSRYFDAISSLNALEKTVTVEPGCTVRDVVLKLQSWGLTIPVLSLDVWDGTIGGLVANGGISSVTHMYGALHTWIQEITFMLPNGEEHRIAPNISPSGSLLNVYEKLFPVLTENMERIRRNTPDTIDQGGGYHIWRNTVGPQQLLDIIIGSQGTLGVVTSVTFRTIEKNTHTGFIAATVQDASHMKVVADILSHHGAISVIFYDELTHSILKNQSVFPHEIRSLPEGILVIGVYTSTDIEVFHQTQQVAQKQLVNITTSITHGENSCEHIFTSIPHLPEHLARYTGETLIPLFVGDGIVVPLHEYVACLESITTSLAKSGVMNYTAGFISSGHMTVVPLIHIEKDGVEQLLFGIGKNIATCVAAHHGDMSGYGGDGALTTPFLVYTHGEDMVKLFKKIKHAFDERDILNPGKKTHLTLTFLSHHIQKRLPSIEQ